MFDPGTAMAAKMLDGGCTGKCAGWCSNKRFASKQGELWHDMRQWVKGSWISSLSQISKKEGVGVEVKNTLRGMKEKVLPWILSICSQTCLHGRFLIISVMAFSAICRSFSPPVLYPVYEQMWMTNELSGNFSCSSLWRTENSVVWVKNNFNSSCKIRENNASSLYFKHGSQSL